MTSFQVTDRTVSGLVKQQEVSDLEKGKVEVKKVGRKKKLGGFSLSYLIPLLELMQEQRSYMDVYKKTNIRFKRSLLNYLNFCIEKQLVIRERKYNKSKTYHNSTYLITQKGRTVLEILR